MPFTLGRRSEVGVGIQCLLRTKDRVFILFMLSFVTINILRGLSLYEDKILLLGHFAHL